MATPLASLLDPSEISSEVLFATIMALSVTASLVIGNQQVDTHALLVAAFGCNIAWGMVDAVMFLVNAKLAMLRKVRVRKALLATANMEEFKNVLLPEIPGGLLDHLGGHAAVKYREFVLADGELPPPVLARSDWQAAGTIWLLDALATAPLLLPFLFIQSATTALRTMHVIAIVMMFGLGISLGKWVGARPLRMGFLFSGLGGVVAAACIALGG